MELQQLISHPITGVFTDKGDSVEITFNANAFTPVFIRKVAAQFREDAKRKSIKTGTRVAKKGRSAKPLSEVEDVASNMERTADNLEIYRNVYAGFLACDKPGGILVDWGITDQGTATKPTFSLLIQLHPATVIGLWAWCMETANPKQDETPKTETSLTTPETTKNGSFGAETSADSPVM